MYCNRTVGRRAWSPRSGVTGLLMCRIEARRTNILLNERGDVMSESRVCVFVRGVEFEKARLAVDAILDEVDRGIHDTALSAAGHPRSPANALTGNVRLSQGQGLSPESWMQIVGELGPLAVIMGRDVWRIIVVPKLKRLFHEDQVSEHDPHQRRGRTS
jgi:hypothetical protein